MTPRNGRPIWVRLRPLPPEGIPTTILNFYTPGKYAVTREAADDFVLNQLNFGSSSLTLTSKGTLVFAKSKSYGSLPYMNSQNRAEVTIKAPLRLDADLTIDGLETDDTRVFLPGAISGTGALIKNGPHTVYVTNATNTYSGGTTINDGCLSMHSQGLGTGPVTVNNERDHQFRRRPGDERAHLQRWMHFPAAAMPAGTGP